MPFILNVKRAWIVAALALAACTQPWQSVAPGTDVSTLIARLGPPRETYKLPDGGTRLMWPTQPMGFTTTAADVDTEGKVVSLRQVLQVSEFNRARVGEWTRTDVLTNFGRPAETAFFARTQREVWSYRYMENNIDPMMFHFYFDPEGILRLTQTTPDPMRERNLRRF